MSDRYVSVLVAPPGRLGVCLLLYTVLSNIAFILFESNAYPGPLTEAAACAENSRNISMLKGKRSRISRSEYNESNIE